MKNILLFSLILIIIDGCISTDVIDDIVDVRLDITNPISSIKVGETYPLMYRYLNNVGMDTMKDVIWTSDDPSVISIDKDGVLLGVKSGKVTITVKLASDDQIMAQINVTSGSVTETAEPVNTRSGTIATTSSYLLTGDFSVTNIDGGILIEIKDNYEASTALPRLVVYLTNNSSTNNGAYEIGEVSTFKGAHSYEVLGENVNVDTYKFLLYYCKPFSVKVGHGQFND